MGEVDAEALSSSFVPLPADFRVWTNKNTGIPSRVGRVCAPDRRFLNLDHQKPNIKQEQNAEKYT